MEESPLNVKRKRLLPMGGASNAVILPKEWLEMMKVSKSVELVLQLDCADADWEIVVRRPEKEKC